jgi:hypothetical protein
MGALGFDAVYRQDFVGWSGTSTKSQVGREVLALTTGGGEWEVPEEVSLHVNCAVYSNGSIVLSYSNLAQSPVVFPVDGLRSEAAVVIAQSPRVEYFLTTGEEGNLQSASVQLNGGGVLTAGGSLQGKYVGGMDTTAIILPALSYGFVVLTDSHATACL